MKNMQNGRPEMKVSHFDKTLELSGRQHEYGNSTSRLIHGFFTDTLFHASTDLLCYTVVISQISCIPAKFISITYLLSVGESMELFQSHYIGDKCFTSQCIYRTVELDNARKMTKLRSHIYLSGEH